MLLQSMCDLQGVIIGPSAYTEGKRNCFRRVPVQRSPYLRSLIADFLFLDMRCRTTFVHATLMPIAKEISSLLL